MILLILSMAVSVLAIMIASRYCTPLYLLRYLYIRLAGKRLLTSPANNDPDDYDVAVSLTTIPSRIKNIFPCINSILTQSRPPDRIYLNLPSLSTREDGSYDIPDAIRKDNRITLCICGEDKGPIMKLLPALERETDPQSLIVTVDDDTVYPRHLIGTLLKFHKRYPGAALGFRGWRLPASGKFQDRVVLYANRVKKPYKVHILSGVSGVLYLRRHFNEDFFERDGLSPESYFVDDICISGYLEKAGIEKYLLPYPMREPFASYLFTSRSNPLWMINRDGRNDQVMIDYYFQDISG